MSAPDVDVAEDVTERMAYELRNFRGPQFAKLTPMTRLTPAGAIVLQRHDGMRLAHVSMPLIYDDPVWRMPKTPHKTLIRLVLGGHMRVYRVLGPLPGDHPPSRVGARSHVHYLLRMGGA